jgi:hypothetical protein
MASHAMATMVTAFHSSLKQPARATLFPVENNHSFTQSELSSESGITQSQSTVAYFVFFSRPNDT